MSDDREPLYTEIPSELKNIVDADSRFNNEIVEASLWREFGGHGKSALEQRITEHEQRKTVIQEEIDARKQELEEIDREIAALRERLEEKRGLEESVLEEADDVFDDRMLEPDNPAVKQWAEKLNATTEEFIEKLQEYRATNE